MTVLLAEKCCKTVVQKICFITKIDVLDRIVYGSFELA